MKLSYIANTRIPTEKSYGMAIMKICESLAASGCEVELVLPTRRNPQFKGEDQFKHYTVVKNFRIVSLPCPDLIGIKSPRPISFLLGLIQYFLFYRELKKYFASRPDTVLFSREQRLLYLLRGLPNFKVYEIHDIFPVKNIFYKTLLDVVDKIIVTNNWKREELIKHFVLDERKISVVPNAVDVDIFLDHPLTKEEARQRLNLSLDKKMVVYVGGFQQWKGVYVLAKALTYLPHDQGIEVHLVGGGPEPERSQFLKFLKLKNWGLAFTHEAVPYSLVSTWMYAADVLVAPGTMIDPRGVFYTSPLKIFEYIATGRPLVLTDLSAVREAIQFALNCNDWEKWKDLFVPPNSPKMLADTIMSRLDKVNEWQPLVSREDIAKRLGWENRAKKIISLLPLEVVLKN